MVECIKKTSADASVFQTQDHMQIKKCRRKAGVNTHTRMSERRALKRATLAARGTSLRDNICDGSARDYGKTTVRHLMLRLVKLA